MWAFACGVVASGAALTEHWPLVLLGVLLAGPLVCATSQAVNDWFDRDDGVVRCVRDFTGYDRVMVYQFDPDGHGKIIAEARDPRLESLLGHHYPATDIP